MQITSSELNSLKTLVYAQKSIGLLGSFPERENLQKRLKQAKKLWWARLRETYELPEDTKFAIELDGDLAGELRIKGSGGVAFEPWRSPYDLPRTSVDPDAAPRAQIINALNTVLRDLGIEAVDRN